MRIILTLAAACLIFASCGNRSVTITQRQPQVPVLKNKEFNNVLEIKLAMPDTGMHISGFTFDISGTTDIAGVEEAALYLTGTRSGFINDNSRRLSESKSISGRFSLKCSVVAPDTSLFFMLSLRLKDDAVITGRIIARCTEVKTGGGTIRNIQTVEAAPQRIGVALRKHRDDGVDTYRIPGLVSTQKGTLIACYDARRDSRRDLQGNIDIGTSRSTDGGTTWEPMVVALDMGEEGRLAQKFNGVSDAALLADPVTGDILVAGLWMHGVLDSNGRWIENLRDTSSAWNHQWREKGSQPGFGIKQTSQFLIAKSSDDGISWGPPENITRMCKKEEWWLWAPAPGNGIRMQNGTLVFPTQGRDRNGVPFSNITFSSDGGRTWKTSSPAFSNTTECAVAETGAGTLMLNMRYNRNRNNEGPDNGRVIAVTNDMGETWNEHPTSRKSLPEPVCMGSLLMHQSPKGGILFFSNPDSKKGRHHLTIKASKDNGESWPENYRLMLDEGTGNGYSCLASIGSDYIGILYESSQANLVFQKIPLSDIVGQ